MTDLHDSIRSEIGDWPPGTRYATCPACSHLRRKKHSRCLSITVHDDRAMFFCHHCEIRGVVFRDGASKISPAQVKQRQAEADALLHADAERRVGLARRIWQQTVPAPETPVETYLRFRGYGSEIPPTLRYARLRHPGTGQACHDVMVAAVGHDEMPVAIHRTYLAAGGHGKAKFGDLDIKLCLGPIAGQPIRLDAVADVADAVYDTLAIGEGVETTLVALEVLGLPAWAAISAGNLPKLQIPDYVKTVTIVADHDEAGITKAREAKTLWVSQGRTVRLILPRDPGSDLNDMLRLDAQEIA
jgi:hypothetical protein